MFGIVARVLVLVAARVEACCGSNAREAMQTDSAAFGDRKLELRRKASTLGSIFGGRTHATLAHSLAPIFQSAPCVKARLRRSAQFCLLEYEGG
jgi:hypothetical protein